MKEGNEMGNWFYLMVFFFVTLAGGALHGQVKESSRNAGIDLTPDEENLDVFQQWIRWNNPGSLLIHHLTKQAMDHYEIRDREIAKLKTKSDWMKRQEIVREKLMEMVGPFPAENPT